MDSTETLRAAKARVMAKLISGDEGVCPCCGQFCKLYQRKFNANMAQFLLSLIKIQRQSGQQWIHYSACRFTGRDYPYIAFWGLAETAPSATGQKRTTGQWRPTEKGILFANNQIRIAQHLFIFNNEILCPSKQTIGIAEALNNPFQYNELMGYDVPEPGDPDHGV